MARSARATKPTGFTLLELILVLAILVAIGAIVAPSVGDAFQRQRLQGSADRLRSQWDRARLTAMKTGQIQVFSCTLGSNTYSIQPFMAADDVLNASAGATVVTSGGTVAEATTGGTLAAPTNSHIVDEKLEEKISFVSCAVNSDMRAMSVAQAQGGLAATMSVNQTVMFYPDGSTSTAEVIIQNAEGAQRAVRMRGLTGTTQVLKPGALPVVAPATGAAPT